MAAEVPPVNECMCQRSWEFTEGESSEVIKSKALETSLSEEQNSQNLLNRSSWETMLGV